MSLVLIMSRAFQPKVAMPLKTEDSMTMFLSLGGTTLIRNELTAHRHMEDAVGGGGGGGGREGGREGGRKTT